MHAAYYIYALYLYNVNPQRCFDNTDISEGSESSNLSDQGLLCTF